mgnify:CR=1 FL=1
MKRRTEPQTPSVYLSKAGGMYSVISQGAPICASKQTAAEALAAAKHFRLTVAPHMWNGDAGEWQPLPTQGDNAP